MGTIKPLIDKKPQDLDKPWHSHELFSNLV
jgi:hypothetical protein